MAVAKPNIQWVPASQNNYTPGRFADILKITFHHTVASDDSAIAKFQNPTSATSAHFIVGNTKITQMVDIGDTAWTNANWASNCESITIEHEGDWRNGFRDEAVIQNSAQLVAWLRESFPGIGFNRHRDVAPTACPADLPVEEIWNRATDILAVPTPPPPPPAVAIQITDIQNRIVVMNKDANLWDLNFTTWATAKSVKTIPMYQPDGSRTTVEVSAIAKHPLGGQYYLSEYSFSKGIKNGINIVDCDELVTPPPPPETTSTTTTTTTTETTTTTTTTTTVPPLPEYPNWFVQFWVKLWEAIKGILHIK